MRQLSTRDSTRPWFYLFLFFFSAALILGVIAGLVMLKSFFWVLCLSAPGFTVFFVPLIILGALSLDHVDVRLDDEYLYARWEFRNIRVRLGEIDDISFSTSTKGASCQILFKVDTSLGRSIAFAVEPEVHVDQLGPEIARLIAESERRMAEERQRLESRPTAPPGAELLRYTPLDERHRPTEFCRRYWVGGMWVPAAGLAIHQFAARPGVYLFYYDEAWQPLDHVYCESIEYAVKQAEAEYRGTAASWRRAVND